MATLICRLAGPLQSWGETAKFLNRPSLPYPTYSGLLGIARASLGYGRNGIDDRTGQPAAEKWLRALNMAIRIDQRGQRFVDYHTVNPPATNAYDWLAPEDRARLATIAMGNGKEWRIGGVPQTMQTWRTYLADAAFTWLIEGPTDDISRLAAALTEPHWQLSLGRKACLPDQPLVLGTTARSLHDCARVVPATGQKSPRQLHLFDTTHVVPSAGAVEQRITHADLPLGPHPRDGHSYLSRTVISFDPPHAASRADLLKWAKENLTP